MQCQCFCEYGLGEPESMQSKTAGGNGTLKLSYWLTVAWWILAEADWLPIDRRVLFRIRNEQKLNPAWFLDLSCTKINHRETRYEISDSALKLRPLGSTRRFNPRACLLSDKINTPCDSSDCPGSSQTFWLGRRFLAPILTALCITANYIGAWYEPVKCTISSSSSFFEYATVFEYLSSGKLLAFGLRFKTLADC